MQGWRQIPAMGLNNSTGKIEVKGNILLKSAPNGLFLDIGNAVFDKNNL